MNVRQITHGREICCQIILITEGASMQQSGSQGQSQGKRSPVVVGIGAAVVAKGVDDAAADRWTVQTQPAAR